MPSPIGTLPDVEAAPRVRAERERFMTLEAFGDACDVEGAANVGVRWRGGVGDGAVFGVSRSRPRSSWFIRKAVDDCMIEDEAPFRGETRANEMPGSA